MSAWRAQLELAKPEKSTASSWAKPDVVLLLILLCHRRHNSPSLQRPSLVALAPSSASDLCSCWSHQHLLSSPEQSVRHLLLHRQVECRRCHLDIGVSSPPLPRFISVAEQVHGESLGSLDLSISPIPSRCARSATAALPRPPWPAADLLRSYPCSVFTVSRGASIP